MQPAITWLAFMFLCFYFFLLLLQFNRQQHMLLIWDFSPLKARDCGSGSGLHLRFVLSVSCSSASSQQCRFRLSRPQYIRSLHRPKVSTCMTAIHTIAVHTTPLHVLLSYNHVSPATSSHCTPHHTPSRKNMCCKCFWDDRLPGRQPSGTGDLTLRDQWNYLISTFRDFNLHAVCVITANPC